MAEITEYSDVSHLDPSYCGNFLSSQMELTVFDLCNISHDDLGHRDLDDLTLADDCKLLLLFNAALKSTELFLFAPVIEGGHQHHDYNGKQDGSTFNPSCLGLALIFNTPSCLATVWNNKNNKRKSIPYNVLCKKIK